MNHLLRLSIVYALHLLFPTFYGLALVSRINKIMVSFAKESFYRHDILQKRPIILIDPTDRSHPIAFFLSSSRHTHSAQVFPRRVRKQSRNHDLDQYSAHEQDLLPRIK